MIKNIFKSIIITLMLLIVNVSAETIDGDLVDINSSDILEFKGIKLIRESNLADFNGDLHLNIRAVNETYFDLYIIIDLMYFDSEQQFITGMKTDNLKIIANDSQVVPIIINDKGFEVGTINYYKIKLSLDGFAEEDDYKEDIGIPLEEVNNKDINSNPQIKNVYLIIPVLSLLISLFLFLLFKRGSKVELIPSNKPPKELGAFEFKYHYYNVADKRILMSYLIPLAVKGYLKIETTNDNLVITKLKDYTDQDLLEKEFFNNFFAVSNVLDFSFALGYGQGTIEQKIPDTSFWTKLNFALTRAIKSSIKKNDFHRLVNLKTIYHKIFFTIIFILGTILFSFNFINLDIANVISSSSMLPFLGGAVPLFFAPVLMIAYYFVLRKQHKKGNVILIFLGLFFILVSNLFLIQWTSGSIFSVIYNNYCYLIYILIMILSFKMKGFTEAGSVAFGLALGFEEYIKNIDNFELERLIKENEKYIFEIYPYLVAFYLEYPLEDKTENIVIANPSWYINRDEEFTLKKMLFDLNSMIEFLSMYRSRD